MSFKPSRASWLKVVVLLAVLVGWQVAVHWWRPVSQHMACAECSVGVPAVQTVGQSTAVSTTASRPDLRLKQSGEAGPLAAWSVRYLQARPGEKRTFEAEGIQLADAQRVLMKDLIQSDPKRALEQAVPMVVRQQLPAFVLARLEQRVGGRGDLETLAVSAPDKGVPAVQREARIDGHIYRAHTYGRRAESAIRKNVPLHGVAVDGHLAVSENPLRVLEVGEIPPANAEVIEVCPVSGITTPVEKTEQGVYPPVTEETPAAQEGYIIRYYCNGGHMVAESERLLEEERTAAESSTGGSSLPGGSVTTGSGQGYRTILYMRCIFPDDRKVMQTETEAWDHLKRMNDYFHESSFGKLFFLSTVTPVIMLPRTSAYYKQVVAETASGSTTELINDAKEAARRMGFPLEEYQHHIMIYSNNGPGSFGGRASAPGSNMWLKSTSDGTFWHEMGHNLGPIHANRWDTGGKSVIGPGVNGEYGNSFDVLGNSGSGMNGHFNASFKQQIGWLTTDLYTPVTSSGTYRIWQFDQPLADPGRRFALQITKDSQRDYWVEFRQKFTTNAWIMNGVHVNWDRWGENGVETSTQGSNGGAQLLDTTPGSSNALNDAALVVGRTFSDLEAGIHITPVAKNATTPPSMDVRVTLGDDAANTAPTLALEASATSVATGVSVNLTATAVDSESDALAYYWNFDDNTVNPTSAATVSKSWSTAGVYAVQCTVSDMRGGWTRKTVLITVGTPTNFTISGTVTDGVNPLRDVVIHSGTVSNTSGKAITDSDGNYTIARLAAGSYTLTGVLDTLTFTPGFTNPVVIGPSVTGINFTSGTPDGVVKVEAIDASGNEAGPDHIAFRLTRTGSTAAALTTTVLVSGNAAVTNDYTWSPAPVAVSPFQTWIIPAGASTLDIAATVVNDVTTEGPELITLGVVPTGGVMVGTPQTATATITDNETTQPTITLFATDPDASESDSADTAEFELRRLGSLSGALNVNVTYSSGAGFATAGTDFTSAGTTITMPDGAATHRFTIATLQDTAVEGLENLRVTLAAGTGYRLGSATVATAKVADDDIPAVSITASDATANETAGDAGAVTITRTGDTTASLKVDYVIGGTATLGVDFQTLAGFALIPAGQTSVTVPVLPIDDTLGEAAQTVILYLRSDTLYTTVSPFSATVTINDNDGSFASVVATDGVAAEPTSDTGVYKFTVRGGSGTKAVKFSLSGTAVLGTDYTVSGATMTGSNGSVNVTANSTANVTITPINDTALEDTESVIVTLASDAAFTIDPLENVSTVILRDNDNTQSVNIANTPDTALESASTAKFWVSRNGSTTAALAVDFEISGTATLTTDYTLSTASPVTIPAASAGVYITVTGVDDAISEVAETLTLTVQPSAAYGIDNAATTLIITDNDAQPIQARFPTAQLTRTVTEDSGTQLITVELSAAAEQVVGVNYSVQTTSATGGGADFLLNQGTLTFEIGETSKTFPLTLLDDSVPEDEEFVILQLTNPSGVTIPTAQSVFSLFILDNEPRVSIAALDDIASGGGNTGTLRMARTGPTSASLTVPFTVSGTATSGTDYTSLGTSAIIAAGQSYVDVVLTPSTDVTVEGTETVMVTLTAASTSTLSATRSATVSLVDAQTDTAPLIRLHSPRTSTVGIPAGIGMVLDATVFHDDLPSAMITTAWSKQSGTGTVTFADAAQPSTTATFSAAGLYVLRLASSDGVQSSTVDVTVNVGATSQAWSATDIGGASGIPGQTVLTKDSVVLSSAGTALSGASDVVRFLSLPITGDVEITARVRSLSNTSANARAGLMLRESTAANARSAFIGGGASSSFGSFGTRITAGASWSFSTGTARPPMWVRLTRVGSSISGYESLDGITWTQRGTTTSVTLGSTPLVGLAAMSASATKPAVAEFDNVTVSAAVNLGPVISAGGDQSLAANQVTLQATTSDDARPDPSTLVSVTWSQLSGPATAVITQGSAGAATAQMSSAGTYVFRAIADDGDVRTFDDMSVTYTLPIVTLIASDASASETGLDPASFLVTRNTSAAVPLTVNLSIGGTATNGNDYAPLSGSVTIPASASSAPITITPLSDSLAEGDETVQLALLASSDYSLGLPDADSITLGDLPVDAWRFQQFGAQANNSAVAADTSDNDNDGIPTLMEYALGLEPDDASPSGLPDADVSPGQCHLVYTRPIVITDVTYIVEWSLNLQGWSSVGVTEQVIGTSGGLQTIRASVTLPGGETKCFMHLRVSR